MHWLRAPDGWIAEERFISNEAVEHLLMPLIANESKKQNTDQCIHKSDRLMYSQEQRLPESDQRKLPFAATLSDDDGESVIQSRSHRTYRHSVSRLEDIRELQITLQDMTRTMNKLTEKIVQCQQAISKLVQGKITTGMSRYWKVIFTC